MEEFQLEGLPLMIMANWRGFSGGQRDLFEGVLQVCPLQHLLDGCLLGRARNVLEMRRRAETHGHKPQRHGSDLEAAMIVCGALPLPPPPPPPPLDMEVPSSGHFLAELFESVLQVCPVSHHLTF